MTRRLPAAHGRVPATVFGFGSITDHKMGSAGLLAVCGAIATLLCLYAADWWPAPDAVPNAQGRGFLDSAQQVSSLAGSHARQGLGTAMQRQFFDWGHYVLAASVVATAISVLTGRHIGAITGAVLSVAGIVCYIAVVWKMRLGYDDSLDVVGIHGVGGFTGILATGLFASIGAQGLFFGNPGQFGIQVVLALVTLSFSVIGTYLVLKIVDMTVGLRVSDQDEEIGLDLSQHNERAYS